MLSGIVDFNVGNVLAGWVQSSDLAGTTVAATIDGKRAQGACVVDPERPDTVKFWIALPRTVSADELISKRVKVDAQTGRESAELEVWEPIQIAARLNDMTSIMVERVVSALSPDMYQILLAAVTSGAANPVQQPAGRLDSSMIEDLMRWS